MNKVYIIFTMAFLLCFTFSCQQEQETTEEFIEEDASRQQGEELIGGLTEKELEVLGDKLLEIWNEGNLDLIEEVFSPEYIIYSDPHDAYENQTLDHETFKERVLLGRSIWSDLQWVVEGDPIIQGDRFAVRTTMSGIYVDTGEQFSVQCFTIYLVEDGKLKGHWQLWDRLGMMQQVGYSIAPPEGKPNLLNH